MEQQSQSYVCSSFPPLLFLSLRRLGRRSLCMILLPFLLSHFLSFTSFYFLFFHHADNRFSFLSTEYYPDMPAPIDGYISFQLLAVLLTQAKVQNHPYIRSDL